VVNQLFDQIKAGIPGVANTGDPPTKRLGKVMQSNSALISQLQSSYQISSAAMPKVSFSRRDDYEFSENSQEVLEKEISLPRQTGKSKLG
jgi:hypothetical protein